MASVVASPLRAGSERSEGSALLSSAGDLFRPLYREGSVLRLLDQRLLPAREVWLTLSKPAEIAIAIRDLAVRGAPAIGVAAAYGASFSMRSGATTPPAERFETASRLLAATRPTAVNLFAALERMARALSRRRESSAGEDRGGPRRRSGRDRRRGHRGLPVDRPLRRGVARDGQPRDDALQRRRARDGRVRHRARGHPRRRRGGEGHPGPRLRDAAVPPGRAPDRLGARARRDSRSRSSPTAWAATFFPAGRSAPSSSAPTASPPTATPPTRSAPTPSRSWQRRTASPSMSPRRRRRSTSTAPTAHAIPIEERSSGEVLTFAGQAIAPAGVSARYAAFDVTPARYITAIVTDRGICRPPYLESLARAVHEVGRR